MLTCLKLFKRALFSISMRDPVAVGSQVELLGHVQLPAEMFTTIRKHMGEEALDAAKEILKLPPVAKVGQTQGIK